MRVFLAHSSAQASECERIVAKLRKRGFKVFYSADTIPVSEDFDRLIRAEIARCGAMIFWATPQSITPGSYPLTELGLASKRWPNPRNRVLAVLAGAVSTAQVPGYLRDNIELFRPQGDLVTEVADAMVELRRRQNLSLLLKFGTLLWLVAALGCSAYAKYHYTKQARLNAIGQKLIKAALDSPVYVDTCVSRLDTFSQYTHPFPVPRARCDARPVVESAKPPLLVVAQTGYGKKGFVQSLRATWAKRQQAAVLISYRDCVRGKRRDDRFDLKSCIADNVAQQTQATPDDVRDWLAEERDYVLIFDGIDDSGSRERVSELIRDLFEFQKRGGSVVLTSQPENLQYVLARYGIDESADWIRRGLPTVDVRGVNVNSVYRLASDYEEHRVDPKAVQTVLDFPQRCPAAHETIQEWISQPKLFREQGAHTVLPVVEQMNALGANCAGWRSGVLAAMLRARFWSYCHDDLCNYRVEGEKYLAAAKELRDHGGATDEMGLAVVAKEQGLKDADELAFALLSTGALFYDGGRLKFDAAWIPD